MQEQRTAVIAEALTFLNTPYHHLGRVKGHGVDCLTFIVAVAENVGLVRDIKIPSYGPQFNLHRSAETYLNGLLHYCREVDEPQPGDLALFKFGRVYSHAAIVIEWPRIIHAYNGRGVTLDDATSPWLASMGNQPRPRKFLSYW